MVQQKYIKNIKENFFWSKFIKYYGIRHLKLPMNNMNKVLAICKINGSLKKTNKKTNVSRHTIRWQKNTKFLESWTLKEW